MEVKSKTTSKNTSSSSSVTRWLSTNSANSVELRTVYWSSTCKVLSIFATYLDTWNIGAAMQLFLGLRETQFNSAGISYEMVVIWLRLLVMKFWKSIKRCRVWTGNLKFLILLLGKVAWLVKVLQLPLQIWYTSCSGVPSFVRNWLVSLGALYWFTLVNRTCSSPRHTLSLAGLCCIHNCVTTEK